MNYLNYKPGVSALTGPWVGCSALILTTILLLGCVAQDGITQKSKGTADNAPSRVGDVRTMPESALGGYLAGHHARHIFDPEAAAEFFSRTLRSDPKNPELLRQLLVAQVARGHLEEALDVAHRLKDQSGPEPLPLLVLAAGKVKTEDFSEAAQLLGAFPETRFYPFIKSLLLAWTTAGDGDLISALTKLDFLNSSPNFAPTHDYHAALISNLLGAEKQATSFFTRALSTARQPSVRSLLAAGAFY